MLSRICGGRPRPHHSPRPGGNRPEGEPRLSSSHAGAAPEAQSASMQSTTIGSRITSFIPASDGASAPRRDQPDHDPRHPAWHLHPRAQQHGQRRQHETIR